MKFRKLKLAALLATAVLTAGTMSLTSLAADDEVEITIDNDGGENEALPEYGVMPVDIVGTGESESQNTGGVGKGFVLDEKSLQFYYQVSGHEDGEVTYIMYLPREEVSGTVYYDPNATLEAKYAFANDKANAGLAVVKKAIASEEKRTTPNCKDLIPNNDDPNKKEPVKGDLDYEAYRKLVYKTITYKVEIDGEPYESEAIPYGEKVQHNWKYSSVVNIEDPTCTDMGEGSFQRECLDCHYVEKDEDGIIPSTGHNWKEDKVYYVGLGTVGEKPEDNPLASWGNLAWKDSSVKEPDKLIRLDAALGKTNGKTRLQALIDDYTPKPNRKDYKDDPSVAAWINVKVLTDANGNVTDVTLKDETKDGCYWTAHKCSKCNALIDLDYHFIWAKTAKYAEITDVTNVSEEVKGRICRETKTSDIPLDGSAVFDAWELQLIELADCRQGGTYTVSYYNGDDGEINSLKFEIPAHHLYECYDEVKKKLVINPNDLLEYVLNGTASNLIVATTIEFGSKADSQLCDVKWVPSDPAKQIKAHWEVKNTGCDAEDPVEYWEVKHCVARDVTSTSNKCGLQACANRFAKGTREGDLIVKAGVAGIATKGVHSRADLSAVKAAPATGYHQIDKKTFDYLNGELDALEETGFIDGKIITWEGLKKFKKWADVALASKAYKYIFTYDASSCYDCDEDGTLVIEYQCKACGYTPIERQTFTLKANPKHELRGATWDESIVDPTCTTTGKHYTMRRCERCQEAVSDGRVVETLRLPHTNELKVDEADTANKNKEPVLLQTLGTIVVDNDGWLRNHPTEYTTYLNYFSNNELALDNALLTVDGYLYTVCDSCKEYKVVLTNPYAKAHNDDLQAIVNAEAKVTNKTLYYNSATAGKVTINVKTNSIVAQDPTIPCKPGSITLVFTYTDQAGKQQKVEKEFPYYTSKATYAARGSHKYGAEYLDTAASVAPTETTEGKNVYKRKCEVCGEETVVRTVTVPALGTPAEKLGAVTGLKAEAIGLGRVQLSWNPVEGADYYTILLHDSFEYQGSIAAVKAPKCTITVSGLDTEVFSHIWVAPVKKGSNGKDTVGDAGEYVSILAREVPSVTGVKTTIEDGKILVTWKAQSRANTYSVVVKSTTDSVSTKYVVGDETEFTLNNTVKGKGYYFWVYAGFENSRTNKDGKSIGQSVSSTGTFASAVAK